MGEYYNNDGDCQQQGYQQQNHSGESDSYYASAQPDYQQQGQQYPPPSHLQGHQQSGYGQQQHQYGQPPQGQVGYGQPEYGSGQQQQYDSAAPAAEGERGVMGALAGGAAGAVGGHKIGKGPLGTIVGGLAGAFAGHKLQDGVSDWKEDRKEKKEEEKRRDDSSDDEDRKHHHRRRSHCSEPHDRRSSSERHDRRDSRDRSREATNFAGNFSASSRDINLDEARGEWVLHALCRQLDGSHEHSSISLNEVLENDNGRFRWSSRGGFYGHHDSTVTVQQGDTLRAIAGRFDHCSYEDIARHNNISNPDMIFPGQVLQVPSGGGVGSGGNFGASARDVRLVDGGRVLEAELRCDGRWDRSRIQLDERIGNENGRLHLV